MKDALLYLLLFTYSASIFKPVIPYLSDMVAHTFYYAEHVKKVHYENGKYHVHNELVRENKKNTTDDKDAMQKKISSDNEHLLITNYSCFFNPHYPNNYFSANPPIFFNIDISFDFPPPRC